ncbi:MAG: transposase [Alphaproteobacteria bacterium]|nr:transposase [Alphaproteobacteria bacterium]
MDEMVTTAGIEHSNERANDVRSSARTEQIEVRVRHERHRCWRPDEKLRIVQETLRPGAVIAEVARRHGIGSGLLYTWRRELLATAVAGFVPVQVAPELEGLSSADTRRAAMSGAEARRMKLSTGRIEVEFPNGVRVRVDSGVDETTLRGVLAVLDER